MLSERVDYLAEIGRKADPHRLAEAQNAARAVDTLISATLGGKKMFVLSIEMGNDQMQTRHHLACALYELAKQLENRDLFSRGKGPMRDANGNKVGEWELLLPKEFE